MSGSQTARIADLRGQNGKRPFSDWMDALESTDEGAYDVIVARIERVEDGNFGDCEPVGEGVHELRIDYGPGYRVYFGQDGDLVILLDAGPKRTQVRDIESAKKHWEEYNA